MRSVWLLLVALLVVPTIGAASWDEREDRLAVTVMRIDDAFVHVSWSAAPGALAYEVHRGPSLDDLELITTTPALEYADAYAPEGDTWYVIISTYPITSSLEPGPIRGKCVAMRGLTGISVTVAHCLPRL